MLKDHRKMAKDLAKILVYRKSTINIPLQEERRKKKWESVGQRQEAGNDREDWNL